MGSRGTPKEQSPEGARADGYFFLSKLYLSVEDVAPREGVAFRSCFLTLKKKKGENILTGRADGEFGKS